MNPDPEDQPMKTRPLIAVLLGGVVLVAAVSGGIWYTTSISPTICWGKDANFNSPNAGAVKRGVTHLHLATLKNACESAARLIAHGADVNVRDRDDKSPLHWAAAADATETAELLIVHGADVNAHDRENRTPLHFATKFNSVETAELLISNGANVNAGRNTFTPLDNAIASADRVIAHANAIKYPSKKEKKKYEKEKKEHEKMVHLLRAHGGRCYWEC